ncbi:MAG: DUF1402 family protein, partial [Erysipelotrichia bacterium]|nr:DUF1402 family protein [Erysipelotrichia bacterium]
KDFKKEVQRYFAPNIIIGFGFFTGVFFAIRWGLTDVSGKVDDLNDRFQYQAEENQVSKMVDGINSNSDLLLDESKIKTLCSLNELSYIAPKNVEKILTVKKQKESDKTIEGMIFAVETYQNNQNDYQKNVNDCINGFSNRDISEAEMENRVKNTSSQDIFPWVNGDKWQTIKESVTKDSEVIKMAAKKADIDPRLIVSDLIVEQLRVYYSARELYEKYFEPLKILSNMNKMSLGVMGIKEATAIEIENHLKDSRSPYYLGKDYEQILNYGNNQEIDKQRYNRLMDNSHYYSYLYAALYLKQMMNQWKNAGYDISNRPEIVGTLFNVGFPQSKPNANPKVGGSKLQIGEKQYTFGRLSYEFFYSGELIDQFPYLTNLKN